MKNLINHMTIPKMLIKNQASYGLTNHDLITIIKLMAVDNYEIDLTEALQEYGVDFKDDILILKSKELLDLMTKENIPYVSLEKLYSKLSGENKKPLDVESNLQNNENSTINEQQLLTRDFLDRISLIIEREITNYELEQLKNWIENYTQQQITDAILKSLTNQIDNFKYIEKVLQNEPANQPQKENMMMERNWRI